MVLLTNLGTEQQSVFLLGILNVILKQAHDCVRTIHEEGYLQLQRLSCQITTLQFCRFVFAFQQICFGIR